MATIANPLAGVFSAPPPPPGVAAPASSDSGSGSDNSGWLTGLGDLFSGVGNIVVSGIRAANTPAPAAIPSGWTYNPATAQYHNAQGQAVTATGTLTSAGLSNNSSLIWVVLAFLAFVLLKPMLRRGGE